MRTNTVGWIAAVLVALEGIWILVLAGLEVAALAAGDTDAVASAIALLVLTVLGGGIVIAFAVAITRGRSWGRSGAIVTQVLIFAVALGAGTGTWASPGPAVLIAAPAVVTFVLLLFAARSAGRTAALDDSVDAEQ